MPHTNDAIVEHYEGLFSITGVKNETRRNFERFVSGVYACRAVGGAATIEGEGSVDGITYASLGTVVLADGEIKSITWDDSTLAFVRVKVNAVAALVTVHSRFEVVSRSGLTGLSSDILEALSNAGQPPTAANPFITADEVGALGGGDMLKTVYDPTNVVGDAFSMSSMVETAGFKVLTSAERTDIGNNTTHAAIVTGNPHAVTKSDVGLANVENTAISTFAGSANITTVGTITAGTWNGTDIANANIAQMAANTVKSNATGSLADQSDLAMGASTVLARLATGNIVAASTAQMKTLLGYLQSADIDTLAELNAIVTDATLDSSTDERPPADHDTSKVTTGTFANARISSSSVTQHVGDIDHNSLQNYAVGEHRTINDAGTGATDLLSADKILALVAGAGGGGDYKDPVDTSTEGLGDITLSGEQTLNGLLTSASRVLVMEQTLGEDNGIYVTGAGAWTRATDADTDAEVTNGMHVLVGNSGATAVYRHQYLLTTSGAITLGTTPLTFAAIPDLTFGTGAGTATEGNDSRIPTQDENDALVGTSGAPSTANKFVTNADSRMTNERTPVDNSATNAKLADMNTQTIKGRNTAGSGDPEDLTATQVRSIINVANGATADAKATSTEINTGTDDAKFATALGLENSKYLNQSGSKLSATASGTDTYTATITPAITAYSATQVFYIKFTNANTGASTINLNTLGAKTLLKSGGLAVVSGDILAGHIYQIAYDGTNFQILSSAGVEGVATGLVAYDAQISPAALTADVNNWNPAGLSTCNVIRALATGGIRDITGILAPSPVSGQVILLVNIGTFTISLNTNDAASTAANRFLIGTSKNLQTDESVQLCYDKTSLRWRVISEQL